MFVETTRKKKKKQLNLVLVVVLVLKSKALYGSCSVNFSLRSSLGDGREEIGTEEGEGGRGEQRLEFEWVVLQNSSPKSEALRMRRRPSSQNSKKRFSQGCTKTMKWPPYCCPTPICSLCKHFLFSQKITRPLITRM